MEVLYPRCAGLDVHKDVVVACVRIAQADGKALQEVRSFATTTTELYQLADWLNEREITHAVMEPQVCTGSRCGTCSRSRSSSCSRTLST